MKPLFMNEIEERARRICPRIIFPEAEEPEILRLVQKSTEWGYARSILVGDPDGIRKLAEENEICLRNIEVVDGYDEQLKEKYASEYANTHKGISQKMILRKLKDPLYFADCMAALGYADSVIAGFRYTTGEVILAASFMLGLKEGVTGSTSFNIVSIPGFAGSEGDTLIFSDVGVCVDPSAEKLAENAGIAAQAAKRLLGWEPRIAFLSYSTKGSGQSESTEKVKNALSIFKSKYPYIDADGEFQMDVALSVSAANKKIKEESSVAGQANILIFPDLNSGNTNIKSVKLFAKAYSLGPVLMGFNKQISDLSRTAGFEHLLGTVAVVAALSEK